MVINDEMMERFFQDKCNVAEADAVIAYLDEHPDIAEKYLGDSDWNEFKSSITLHPAVSQKMLSIISDASYGPNKRINWLRYVAAACMIGLVITGIKYLAIDSRTNDNKVEAELKKEIVPVLNIVNNNNRKSKQILLKDSSVVLLEPGSELSFYDPFEPNKRSVYLKGGAFFKVAKDKTKPFTVYSSEIATTALGTEFRVNDFEKSATISVKLFEGKVVINSANSNNKKLEKEFYLLPGDEFSYNKNSLLAKVTNRSKTNKTANVVTGLKTDRPDNWFMFNNQNLTDVFDQLSEIYAVKIKYDKADISRMRLIGKITKQDSITVVLNDIALLNNLLVTKTGDGYTITKK